MKRNPQYQRNGKTVALNTIEDVKAIFARNDENEIYDLIASTGGYMLVVKPGTIEEPYLLFGSSFDEAEAEANRITEQDDRVGVDIYDLNQTRIEADGVEFETAY